MREAALAEAARVEAEAAVAPQEKKAGFFGNDADSKPAAAPVKVDVNAILAAPNKRRRLEP